MFNDVLVFLLLTLMLAGFIAHLMSMYLDKGSPCDIIENKDRIHIRDQLITYSS